MNDDIDNYYRTLEQLWPSDDKSEPTRELFKALEEATSKHPREAGFWVVKGDAIQLLHLGPAEPIGEPLENALRYYEKAVAIDPSYAEAWCEIGSYFDAFEDDFPRALKAFQKSIETGGEITSYLGRARVLAQMGRTDEAIESLSGECCPYSTDHDVKELLSEIEAGQWC